MCFLDFLVHFTVWKKGKFVKESRDQRILSFFCCTVFFYVAAVLTSHLTELSFFPSPVTHHQCTSSQLTSFSSSSFSSNPLQLILVKIQNRIIQKKNKENNYLNEKKSRIRETLNLFTCADSSAICPFWYFLHYLVPFGTSSSVSLCSLPPAVTTHDIMTAVQPPGRAASHQSWNARLELSKQDGNKCCRNIKNISLPFQQIHISQGCPVNSPVS